MKIDTANKYFMETIDEEIEKYKYGNASFRNIYYNLSIVEEALKDRIRNLKSIAFERDEYPIF